MRSVDKKYLQKKDFPQTQYSSAVTRRLNTSLCLLNCKVLSIQKNTTTRRMSNLCTFISKFL